MRKIEFPLTGKNLKTKFKVTWSDILSPSYGRINLYNQKRICLYRWFWKIATSGSDVYLSELPAHHRRFTALMRGESHLGYSCKSDLDLVSFHLGNWKQPIAKGVSYMLLDRHYLPKEIISFLDKHKIGWGMSRIIHDLYYDELIQSNGLPTLLGAVLEYMNEEFTGKLMGYQPNPYHINARQISGLFLRVVPDYQFFVCYTSIGDANEPYTSSWRFNLHPASSDIVEALNMAYDKLNEVIL